MPLDHQPHRSRPFQFGIGSILLLTTIGAVVIGVGRLMDAPIVWIIGICLYCFMFLVYLTFRVPYLWRISFGRDSDWQRVQARRKELEAMAQRATQPETPAHDDTEPERPAHDDTEPESPSGRGSEADQPHVEQESPAQGSSEQERPA